MTIKEMEARTGLTRANIRFYEAEGLIAPERRPNGYRDYSEEDLAVLQRVKLLRSLHMSLEEIKAVHAGDHTLAQALDQHLAKLEQDQADLERSKTVCQVMQGDGVRYETLDAPRYLEELERAAQGPPAEFTSDQLSRVKAPWRRFFARTFDFQLYMALLQLPLILMGYNVSEGGFGMDLLALVVGLLLMFLLEPVLLSRFGTTPGKAILGLSVTNYDGGRLTYEEAYQRTMLVLIQGMGLCIPIYEWVRNYKCYTAVQDGKILEWEEESVLVLKDSKLWRVLLILVMYAGLIFGLAGIQMATEPPHNTGEITVAEFCENYNNLIKYHGMDSSYTLEPDGTWTEQPQEEVPYIVIKYDRPILTFREENGVMTGMTYTLEGAWNEVMAVNYQDEMGLAVLAFVAAQEDYSIGFWTNPLEDVLWQLSEVYLQVDETLFGVHITAHSEWESEGDQAKVEFSMEKLK